MNSYNVMRFEYPSSGFQASDLRPAAKGYHRICFTVGTGSTYTQEKVLELSARAADPASIPFWVGLLDFARPRDTFTTARETTAQAPLAYLAICHDSCETQAVPREWFKAPRPRGAGVRALLLEPFACGFEALAAAGRTA